MTDYTELVKTLRWCDADFMHECDNCLYVKYKHSKDDCMDRMLRDAAAAIEALEEDNADLNETVSSLIGMLKSFGEEPIQVGKAGNKYTLNEPKRGEMVEVVRCKDCKHRPTGTGVNHDIEFPDARCPCQCYEDYWYSWMPSDDWYCGNGEKMEVQDETEIQG